MTAGSGSPRLTRAVDELPQVGAQQGGEGGVQLGRGGALELPERPDRLVRERDVHVGQPLGERLAERALVLRMAVGVQQADGDGLRLGGRHGVERGGERLVVERLERAVGAHPLARADAAVARDERRGVRRAQAVQVGARLAAELDEVLEALGGDERGPRALALQQRVGGDGGPVGEGPDLVGARVRALQRGGDRRQHALGLVARRGRRLGGDEPAARGHHRVGEGPAYVDPEQHLAANLPGCRRLASGGQDEVLRLGQVLVRRAVAVVRAAARAGRPSRGAWSRGTRAGCPRGRSRSAAARRGSRCANVM